MACMQPRREGFALLMVLVVVAIIIVAALAVLPSVAAIADHERVDLAYEVLDDLLNARTGPQVKQTGITRFKEDTGVYPGTLRHLHNPITTTQRSLCGATYSATAVDQWPASTVYRSVSGAGMWLGIGMAQDTLLRSPTTGTPNTLIVVINDVDARDASLLNTRVDPETEATPSTLGTIRWGAPDASGRVRVEWRKAITAC